MGLKEVGSEISTNPLLIFTRRLGGYSCWTARTLNLTSRQHSITGPIIIRFVLVISVVSGRLANSWATAMSWKKQFLLLYEICEIGIAGKKDSQQSVTVYLMFQEKLKNELFFVRWSKTTQWAHTYSKKGRSKLPLVGSRVSWKGPLKNPPSSVPIWQT